MAKIRPAHCYRYAKRAFTRVSRYREESYVKGVPGSKIRKFDMGKTNGEFELMIGLKSRSNMQIRHNALEAFRANANKNLEIALGKDNYHLKLKVYPHQVMRHNPTANFAGADRFSSGMKHCWGKTLGRAAVIKKGQVFAFAKINTGSLTKAKDSLRIACHKLPCKYSFEVTPQVKTASK